MIYTNTPNPLLTDAVIAAIKAEFASGTRRSIALIAGGRCPTQPATLRGLQPDLPVRGGHERGLRPVQSRAVNSHWEFKK